ncbi:MAG: hypothetical protein WBO68_07740 [Pyrinomonadaceae bacterium]
MYLYNNTSSLDKASNSRILAAAALSTTIGEQLEYVNGRSI